jgi:hypothetical protein
MLPSVKPGPAHARPEHRSGSYEGDAPRTPGATARRLFLVASDAERLQLGVVISGDARDVRVGHQRLEGPERIMYTALLDAVVRARSTTLLLSDRALREDMLVAVVAEVAALGVEVRRLRLPRARTAGRHHFVMRDGRRIAIETLDAASG